MDALTLLLEYVYIPLAVALYALHIKFIKLDTKVQDYLDFKKDIYTTLHQISTDVHYLIKIREDEK